MGVGFAGSQAQTLRMKTIAENISNASTTPTKPTERPYQRKLVAFKNVFDAALGANKVVVSKIVTDTSSFIKKFEPGHPAADKEGYVLTPNVHPILEAMDMREANRSYMADLEVIDASRTMLVKTLDMLHSN